MKRRISGFVVSPALLLTLALQAQLHSADTPFPNMASANQYLIADQNVEIALTKSAVPKSIADKAEVLVLGPDGYKVAVKGSNGFVCVVERSWASPTTAPDFWNPKLRAPNCFNAAAARTFLPIFLMRTKLVLAGKSKAEILHETELALDKKELPPLEPGAMCYIMSKQQYLGDCGMNGHPHLMFFVSGDAAETWGADLPDSPVIAANNPEERVTIFMIWVGEWSDGTPAPQMIH